SGRTSPPPRSVRSRPRPRRFRVTASIPSQFQQQRSMAAFDRASKLMPGGVNSPARAFGAVGGKPLFIDHAQGPYLHDIDGNRLIDYIGSWGPMILGHAHPTVVEAIVKAAQRG